MSEPLQKKFSAITPANRFAIDPKDKVAMFDWTDAMGNKQVAVWISTELEDLGDARGLQAAYDTTIDMIGRVTTDVSSAVPERVWRTIYHGSDLLSAKKIANQYLAAVRFNLNSTVKVGIYVSREPGGEA